MKMQMKMKREDWLRVYYSPSAYFLIALVAVVVTGVIFNYLALAHGRTGLLVHKDNIDVTTAIPIYYIFFANVAYALLILIVREVKLRRRLFNIGVCIVILSSIYFVYSIYNS